MVSTEGGSLTRGDADPDQHIKGNRLFDPCELKDRPIWVESCAISVAFARFYPKYLFISTTNGETAER